MLSHLKDIREGTFPIRRLTDSEDSEEMMWTYRGPNTHTFKERTSFIDEITKAVGKGSQVHLVPLARNFAAVDSILYYDPNDPKAVLTCIQITMKESHPVDVKGLKRIQGWLKHQEKCRYFVFLNLFFCCLFVLLLLLFCTFKSCLLKVNRLDF
jgi:hypothetical protein